MRRLTRVLLAAVLSGGVSGCGKEPGEGTGILLSVTFGADVRLDQLRVTPVPRGEEGLGGRRVPERPRAIDSGVKIEVRLPESWSGQWVEVGVEGLLDGTLQARGEGSVALEPARLTSLEVHLSAPSCGTSCPVGERRCGAAGVERCEADARGCGRWGASTPCPKETPYCTNGACAASCSDECEGEGRRCSEGGVQVCGQFDADACREWGPVQSCGEGKRCQGSEAQCRPAMASCSTPRCDGRVCGPDPVCGLSCGVCEVGVCSGSGTCVVTPTPTPPTGGWTAHASGTTKRLDGVWGGSPTDVLIVSSEGVVLRAMNGGPAFAGGSFVVEAHPKVLFAVWGPQASELWAVGAWGVIERWDGGSWRTVASPTTDSLHRVHGSGASHVFAVGSGGRVVGYDGSTWRASPLPGVGQLYGVWADHGWVWAVGGTSGTQGEVVVNSSGYVGGSFAKSYNTGNYLNAVWGSSSSDVWMVGNSGLLLRYKNGSYASVTSPTTKHLNGIWGTASSDIWAVGQDGTVLHFDGVIWKLVSTPTNKTLLDVHGSSSTDVWAVGLDGTVLHYR